MSEEKLSLWKLQDVLLEAEEGLADESVNLEEILGCIANKVDNIKQIIDMMNDEAARFKRYEAEMKKRSQLCLRGAERLEGYVLRSLEAHNTTFEVGNLWTAKIREAKYVKVDREPTFVDALEYPSVVKTTYSWDKRAIKDTLKETELPYAKMETSRALVFATTQKRGQNND